MSSVKSQSPSVWCLLADAEDGVADSQRGEVFARLIVRDIRQVCHGVGVAAHGDEHAVHVFQPVVPAEELCRKLGIDYYLRYCLNQHLDFPATVAALRTVRSLYPNARTVLIEDKANGSAIIQTLRKEMFCIPVNPQDGKIARVNAIAPAIESGHVYLPYLEGAPWVEAYIDQFSLFPNGAHDDMVDATSQKALAEFAAMK